MNAARTSRRRVAASTICLGLLAVSRIRTIQSIIRRGKGRVNTQLEQLPPLPAKTAEKMQVLLDKCKEVYEPIKMSTAEMEQEMKRYFVPADSSPSAGEVNQLDVARLLVEAGLGPRDSFVDVGSGVGKLVLTAVASTKVGSAWGLELSPFRTEAAKQAVDQLRNLGVLHAQEHARAHFIQGSCGDELPDAVLHATHFMLTIRPVSGRSMSEEGPVNQFLHVLARSRRERQKPCVLWSVNKQLPLSKGMRHVRTVELPGGLTSHQVSGHPHHHKEKSLLEVFDDMLQWASLEQLGVLQCMNTCWMLADHPSVQNPCAVLCRGLLKWLPLLFLVYLFSVCRRFVW